MAVLVIWVSGLALTLKAVLEIVQIEAPADKRTAAIILIVLTSWVGAIFYTFYARSRIRSWLN